MPHEPKTYNFFQNASNEAFEKARALRKNQTEAEEKLWHILRNRKVGGLKFRRQHPFEEYILDFYCPEKKIAVEVDGEYHLTAEQTEYDKNRTGFLEEHEVRVLRFMNSEVFDDLENVLERIRKFAK